MASRNGRRPPNPQNIPKQHGRRPAAPKVSTKTHGKKPPPPKPDSDKCCPMVAAVRSARRGQFRLARRYATLSVRLLAGRIAW
jgi:hypothetical protein